MKAQIHALSTSYAAEQQKNRVLEEDLRDALSKLDSLQESNTSRQELARKLEVSSSLCIIFSNFLN